MHRLLRERGFVDVVCRTSAELDLRDRDATFEFFREQRPDCVVGAAARAGGIMANTTRPAELMSDNLRIQLNLLDAANEYGTERLLFFGSSRAYPADAPQPIAEDAMLTGPLERGLEAYAVGKIAGVIHVQALRRQYGRRYISVMPANLYGPGDNFALPGAHVVPMLLRRMHEAREAGAMEFVVYGSGRPRREFVYSEDLAEACLLLLTHYDDDAPVNVGSGSEITIAELAQTIARVVRFDGELVYDTTKPDGAMSKLLDSSRLRELGWTPHVSLEDGLRRTYRWFLENKSASSNG